MNGPRRNGPLFLRAAMKIHLMPVGELMTIPWNVVTLRRAVQTVIVPLARCNIFNVVASVGRGGDPGGIDPRRPSADRADQTTDRPVAVGGHGRWRWRRADHAFMPIMR